MCLRCNIMGPFCIFRAHEQKKTFGTQQRELWQIPLN